MGQKRRPQPKRLPSKLLEIRKRLGLTQDQMAQKLKRVKAPPNSGAISRFEKGEREPSLLVLLAYARLGGTSTDVLIDDEQEIL